MTFFTWIKRKKYLSLRRSKPIGRKRVWKTQIRLLLCLGVFFMCLKPIVVTAMNGPSVIGEDSVVCGFLAWEDLYARGIETLKQINKPENNSKKFLLDMILQQVRPQIYYLLNLTGDGKAKQSKQGYCEKPIVLKQTEKPFTYSDAFSSMFSPISDKQTEDAFLPTLPKLVKRILAFHELGIFMPRGGLWGAVEDDYSFRLILEGRFKPKELYDILKSFPLQISGEEIVSADCVHFKIFLSKPFEKELEIKLLSDSICIGTGFSKNTHLNRWEEFVMQIKDGRTVFGIQLDGEKLLNLAKRSIADEKMQICFWNNRLLQGALNMYNLYEEKSLTELDMDKLLNRKYLRFIPVCHDGGKYVISGDLKKGGTVVCSIHGSLKNPVRSDYTNVKLGLTDPRLQFVSRIRLLMDHVKTSLAVQITDPTTLSEAKKMVSDEITKEELDTSLREILLPVFKRLTEQSGGKRLFTDRDWIGILYEKLGADAIFDTLVRGKYEEK